MPTRFAGFISTLENAIHSIRDSFLRESDIIKEKPFGHLVWGLHSGYKKFHDSQLNIGDEVFIYITSPVKAYVIYGVIKEKFMDSRPYWPKDSKHNDKWPYRLLIKIYRLPRSVRDSPDDSNKWDYNELIKFSEVKIPLPQSSLLYLEEHQITRLKELMNEKGWIKMSEGGELSRDRNDRNYLKKLIKFHLISGKNVILVGPPGTGKTRMAKELCKELNISYDIITAHAEMTTFDLIGGDVPSSRNILKYKLGDLSKAVLRCWKRIKDEGKPHWFIIDEINRANIDLAFGKAFTLMDIEHRRDFGLLSVDKVKNSINNEVDISDLMTYISIDKENEIMIPYSFRILATMNSYDRAILIKLGFALLRRFAIIHINNPFLSNVKYNEIKLESDFISRYSDKKIKEECLKEALNQLIFFNDPDINDYGILDANILNKVKTLNNEFLTELDLFLDFLVSIVKYLTVKKIVEYGYAHIVDAFKFIIVSSLSVDMGNKKAMSSILDEAIASYILPQLDVVGPTIKSEEILGGRGRIRNELEFLRDIFEVSELNKSYRLMELLLEEGRIL